MSFLRMLYDGMQFTKSKHIAVSGNGVISTTSQHIIGTESAKSAALAADLVRRNGLAQK